MSKKDQQKTKPSIGFIGQGWIGKHYADDFENRGFTVTRYALETPYIGNKEKIKKCDIVFIAVPTPTTKDGFDGSLLEEVVPLVGKGKIAVIKSTIQVGFTEKLQKANPDIYVTHSPEFLKEVTAAYDAAHPIRNIIGIPVVNEKYRQKAQKILDVLPSAPYELVCQSKSAELIKYSRNCFGYVKLMYINILYDFVRSHGLDWEEIKDAMSADPSTGEYFMDPVHDGGRGAGGHCFIKDFAAFHEMFDQKVKDAEASALLQSMQAYNLSLLLRSGKNIDLASGVYGHENILKSKKKNNK